MKSPDSQKAHPQIRKNLNNCQETHKYFEDSSTVFNYLKDRMHKRNSIQIFINSGGNLDSTLPGNRKKDFNSLSQIGTLFSQATVLPTMMQELEVSPMSRYLEEKNNECYILMSLLRLLITRDHHLEEFRTISFCQAISFSNFMSVLELLNFLLYTL